MTRPAPETAFLRPEESGNGSLVARSRTAVDIEIDPDPVLAARQWFHFGLRAPRGTSVRIVNAGSSTYPAGWADSVVWARAPKGGWQPLELRYRNGIASFTHGAFGQEAAYALFPPYPTGRLERLARRARARGGVDVAGGCEGHALRFGLGDGDPRARQVWVIGGQHGGEHPAMWFADSLMDSLLRRRHLPAGVRFHVVPVANPDGMRAGHLRTNPQGQDPNRFWGEPEACPQVGSLMAEMERTGVDVLIDVHTDFEMGCVYLDVLDEWMRTAAPLVAMREGFERGLARRSPDVSYGRRYPWTCAPAPGLLAGMCAPAVERRCGAASITLELPIGRYVQADGGRGIWTPDHSRALGRATAAVLAATKPVRGNSQGQWRSG